MYRKLSACGLRALFLVGVSGVSLTAAEAADIYSSGSLKDGPAFVSYDWTGFYAGTNSGGVVGTGKVTDPFGPSIYGDNVTSPSSMFGGQIGYNRQMNKWVVGVEADADWAGSDGRNTCLARSGDYVSADCRVKTNALGTLAGRLGYAAGPEGRTLVFAKGGGAWTSNRVSVVNNHQFEGGEVTNTTNFNAWGWMVGGGVEHALTPRWSVKAEYNYLDFGDNTIAYPASTLGTPTPLTLTTVPAGTTKIGEQEHVFKVGVNYHVGAVGPDWGGAYTSPFDLFGGAASTKDAAPASPGWSFDFGARYWASTGKFVWDVKQENKTNISRLTYSGLDGNSGELFARVDTPYNVYVKGTVGLGAINSGKEHDEDWAIGSGTLSDPYIPYSNTVSNEGNGTLGYATADVGFTYLRGTDYRVGPFVGYSYLTQGFDSRGCVQIAVGGCVPPEPTSVLVGSQTGEWNAVRLGASADYSLGYGFRLTTDAAWLPTASFKGRDNHLLRTHTTYSDQKVDNGQGVELEAILSYDFSNRLNLGLGGRYWAMWGDGTFTDTDYSQSPVTTAGHRERISTERYGLLVQGSYKLDSMPEPLPKSLK